MGPPVGSSTLQVLLLLRLSPYYIEQSSTIALHLQVMSPNVSTVVEQHTNRTQKQGSTAQKRQLHVTTYDMEIIRLYYFNSPSKDYA